MVHAVLIVKEAELVIIRADAIHQLLRVMSFQPRARLPIDHDSAEIENDVGDGGDCIDHGEPSS